MLLAGDLGGTKTLIGLFTTGTPRPEPVATHVFTTSAFGSLGDMVTAFLDEAHTTSDRIGAACFGVAGPVMGTTAQLTHVLWRVDAAEVGSRFSIRRVGLLNDLEAMAYAVPALAPSELEVLQEGRMAPGGNKAIIAAGTGLGEALLHHVQGRLVPSASEGGHADFAARTPAELRVLRELTRTFGRVGVERVVSGPGLVNLHRVLHTRGCPAVDADADPSQGPALISQAALERRCPQCVETLQVFVAAFGAEAGNLALRSMATGGVYVGGGIAPRILPALREGAFLEAFGAKAPLDGFMRTIPLFVILNATAGLLGAAVYAAVLENAAPSEPQQ